MNDRVTYDDDDGFDELVASNVSIHMEMNDVDDAYMNIYTDDMNRFAQVFIRAENGKLTVTVEDHGVWST